MKVGVFAPSLQPDIGGGFSFEQDLLQAFLACRKESRHEFVVLGWRKAPPKLIADAGVPYFRLTGTLGCGKLARLARASSNAWGRFKNRGQASPEPSRFERQTGVEMIWSLAPTCPGFDVPYMVPVWDLQHRLQPCFPEISRLGVWEKRDRHFDRVLSRATYVISGTEAGKREIELFYRIPAERIRILRHPTPAFALAAPQTDDDGVLRQYGIKPGYLFYPAQFWSHKNHSNLLLALKTLRDTHHVCLPLVLVGSDQGNLGYVRRLAGSLGVGEQVRFLGHVPTQELVSLYRGAFALTYVSWFGPENLPPLEAMALGVPVIAAKVPGAEEQLTDAALLVSPGHASEIAAAIMRLSDDSKLCAQLIERGRQRARQFTGKDFVRGVFAILDEFEAIRRCWQPGRPNTPNERADVNPTGSHHR